MTVKDLRIGNLMYGNSLHRKEIVTVKSVNENGFSYDGLNVHKQLYETYCHKDSLKPVLLTEKLFIKFKFHKDNYGVFEKTKDNTYTSKSEFELWAKKCKVKNKWCWDISIGKDFGNTTHICYIQYVYQLQNIYFAITRKELILEN